MKLNTQTTAHTLRTYSLFLNKILQGENKDLNEKLSEAVKRNDKAAKGIAKVQIMNTLSQTHQLL